MYRVRKYYKGDLINEYKTPIYPKELKNLHEKKAYESWDVVQDSKGRTVEASYQPTIWKIEVQNIEDK